MEQRLESFLTLCDTMHYGRAAEKLHLSQPAVSKHIQSLENQYGVSLFTYANRRLQKTREGEVLQQYVQTLRYNEEKLMEKPLYFDTSFSGDYLQKEGVSGMLTKEAFVDLIHAMGSDCVLFGTDSPWSGQKDAVQWFMETDLTETEKKKILSDNFIRIIGI